MNPTDLERARRYCAYRERSHSEVRRRLIEWKIFGDDLEEIMVALIDEGFLNEERYAKAYVRGKFSINQWGRNKIREHLQGQQVSSYCIRKGMEEIDEKEYAQTIGRLIAKRRRERPDQNDFQVCQYLAGRGYEFETIKKVIDGDASTMD